MNMCIDELAQEGDKDAHRVLSSHMNMVMSAQDIITTGNLAKLLLQCPQIPIPLSIPISHVNTTVKFNPPNTNSESENSDF